MHAFGLLAKHMEASAEY